MSRTSTLVVVLSVGQLANAQQWCAPGAQWNYSIGGLGLSGYIVRTYEEDTLFEGLNAQRIHETGYQVMDWLPPDQGTITIDRYAHTAVVDSTLLIWGNTVNPEGWDTLFRFNAQIGDRWWPPGAEGICDDGMAGMVMLVDTGHTIIDGVHLRTWTLDFCMSNGDPWGYVMPFTERLGYAGGLMLMPGGCIVVEYGELLSCYTDNEISYNDQTWPYGCASVTGVPEVVENGSLLPFPNPGSDHFTLGLSAGAHTIVLFDATGRCVKRLRTNDPRTRVDTSSLPAGIYQIKIDEVPIILRWAKS